MPLNIAGEINANMQKLSKSVAISAVHGDTGCRLVLLVLTTDAITNPKTTWTLVLLLTSITLQTALNFKNYSFDTTHNWRF